MARGEGRTFKRGNRWWIAYYVKKAGRSVEKREPGGKTEKEAEKKLTQRLNERAAAAMGARPFTGPESERVTIEDLLCSLEAQYRIEKREEKKSHSHMVPLRDFFGVQKAFEVTADRVREYIAHRRRAGKADGTIARELHILRRAYSLAVEDKKLFPYQVPTMPALSDDNVREGFVEKGDFDRIVAYLQQQDPDVADFVLWGFWTGMRKGEITKLTWAAVDKDLTALILPRRSAKTKTSRKLILQGVYREIIVRRARARRPGRDFIFHREGQAMGSFRKLWKTACTEAKVSGLLFHDLRRSAVRNMIRAGIEKTVAKKISGHKTDAVLERYNITDDGDLEEAQQRMEDYISALPVTPKDVPLKRVG